MCSLKWANVTVLQTFRKYFNYCNLKPSEWGMIQFKSFLSYRSLSGCCKEIILYVSASFVFYCVHLTVAMIWTVKALPQLYVKSLVSNLYNSMFLTFDILIDWHSIFLMLNFTLKIMTVKTNKQISSKIAVNAFGLHLQAWQLHNNQRKDIIPCKC